MRFIVDRRQLCLFLSGGPSPYPRAFVAESRPISNGHHANERGTATTTIASCRRPRAILLVFPSTGLHQLSSIELRLKRERPQLWATSGFAGDPLKHATERRARTTAWPDSLRRYTAISIAWSGARGRRHRMDTTRMVRLATAEVAPSPFACSVRSVGQAKNAQRSCMERRDCECSSAVSGWRP